MNPLIYLTLGAQLAGAEPSNPVDFVNGHKCVKNEKVYLVSAPPGVVDFDEAIMRGLKKFGYDVDLVPQPPESGAAVSLRRNDREKDYTLDFKVDRIVLDSLPFDPNKPNKGMRELTPTCKYAETIKPTKDVVDGIVCSNETEVTLVIKYDSFNIVHGFDTLLKTMTETALLKEGYSLQNEGDLNLFLKQSFGKPEPNGYTLEITATMKNSGEIIHAETFTVPVTEGKAVISENHIREGPSSHLGECVATSGLP